MKQQRRKYRRKQLYNIIVILLLVVLTCLLGFTLHSFENVFSQRLPCRVEESEELVRRKAYSEGRFHFRPLRPDNRYLLEPWYIKKPFCVKSSCSDNSNFNKTLKGAQWTMVQFVKSSAHSFYRREMLRRSWGSLRFVEGVRFETLFIVGWSNSSRTKRKLIEENEKYGDILQYDGPDDYKHIALKTLSGMEWCAKNLNKKWLYSSMDDDFMIHVVKARDAIDDSHKQAIDGNWGEFPILCMFRRGEGEEPVREANGLYKKWYINESTFQWHVFPVYCHGGMYSASVQVITDLFEISRVFPDLYLDDVWITGILRQKLGMPDDMIVEPDQDVAIHFTGYVGKEKDGVTEYVKQWEKQLILFDAKNKTVCQCYKS